MDQHPFPVVYPHRPRQVIGGGLVSLPLSAGKISVHVHLDYETRSQVDLETVGLVNYARHESTRIICAAFKINDSPTKVWRVLEGAPMPLELQDAMTSGHTIWHAWNAQFERALWPVWMTQVYENGYDAVHCPPLHQWRCSMAQAAANGYPLKLEKACRAVGPQVPQKDMAGNRVMLQLSKPRRDGTFYEPTDAPEKFAITYDYCIGDVDCEAAMSAFCRPLDDDEQRVWQLDQQINARGIPVDLDFAHAAIAIDRDLMEMAEAKLFFWTTGDISSVTQVGRLQAWLHERDPRIVSLTREAVRDALALTDLTEPVRRVLEIRQQFGMSSTSKYQTMVDTAQPDGRVRNTMQYHAAGTGRWGGRGIQPQNLFKPTMEVTPVLRDIIRSRNTGLLNICAPPMAALASAMRGTIRASEGKILAVADLNAIEPRVLHWLAGDTATMEKWARNEDQYWPMAERIFGLPRSQMTKDYHRQVGKFAVLGCGYGMGAEKFQATCATFGIVISIELAQMAVNAYREANQQIKDFWWTMERQAMEAVRHPGVRFTVGQHLTFCAVAGGALWLQLPSGRRMAYPSPSIGLNRFDNDALRYKGEVGQARVWADVEMYGGKWAENVVQAVSRDVLVNPMMTDPWVERHTIFHVHDELVTEVPVAEGLAGLSILISAMSTPPSWAQSLPLSAEGWCGMEYRK